MGASTRRGSNGGFRLGYAHEPAASCAGGCVARRFGLRIGAVAVALICALLLGAPAFADVLQTDVVAGKTVEERGLDEAQCLDISAPCAIVVGSNGETYFERSADEPCKIASLTKIMTAIVALESASLDTQITVDNEAATVGQSSAGLLEGDTMDLETALYALLVPSGNDAAIAIANTLGASMATDGQSAQEAFVAAMNAKAAEIGCADTTFDNPHGLDYDAWAGDAHSTARDVATMVTYAMQNDTFRAVVGGGSTTITVTGANGLARSIALESTDELMGSYEGLCGVKTGTTDEAGYCFAGACSRDEGELYTVVLNAPSSEERFSDTAAMLDWTYEAIRTVPLISAPSTVDYQGNASPLVASVAQSDWPDSTVPTTVDDPSLSAELFTLAGPVSQEVSFETLEGDIQAGDVVGSLTFTQDGETVAECDLVAAQDAPAPDFFQKIGVWWDRLFRNMQGQPTVAESACYNNTAELADR